MSLIKPEKIRTLQRKLYGKAKAEPEFRFYQLYDKVWRDDILEYAYACARDNRGAPGVDGVTFAMIEEQGSEAWLAALQAELRAKTYRSQPVRRVTIPKPGGGERPLGIPTIQDRVVQTAVKLVIEPIFEADFEPNTHGYRPKRSAADAVQAVHGLLKQGYTDVVDADLSKYFDTIPHDDLIQCVARRIVDRQILALIKMWLKTPVEEKDRDGTRRITGGKGNTTGTPQGGVISPLLANLYINRFLKHWRLTERERAFRAHIVSYADDFVILSRGRADEALAWTRGVMAKLGLTINEAKTSVKNARQEQFDFLGYSFGPHFPPQQKRWKTGRAYQGASPSKKSIGRLKGKVRDILVAVNPGIWDDVRDRLNAVLRGWSGYFSYGALANAHRAVNHHVAERVRVFLTRRHKVRGHGYIAFPDRLIYGELGVLRLSRKRKSKPAVGLP
jgi:RNA-directed DNA polymerase